MLKIDVLEETFSLDHPKRLPDQDVFCYVTPPFACIWRVNQTNHTLSTGIVYFFNSSTQTEFFPLKKIDFFMLLKFCIFMLIHPFLISRLAYHALFFEQIGHSFISNVIFSCDLLKSPQHFMSPRTLVVAVFQATHPGADICLA